MSGDTELMLLQAMQQAVAAYNAGEWATAEHFSNLILNAQPEHFGALTLLGIIAAQTRRAEEAAALLGRAVAARPSDARAHNNYGNALKDLKRFDSALTSYEQALKLNPEYAEAYSNRGLTLRELKRFEEALASFERALEIKPDYAEAHNNRGVTLHELKRFEDSLACYEYALKIKPDYAEAYYNRGLALHELERFKEALDSYERALTVKPNYPEAYNNRGLALHELKCFEDALTCYECALKINPDYAEAYNNRGLALHALKRFAEALDSYGRALNVKPDYAEVYNNRGLVLHELKRFAEALDSYEHALQVKPDYAEAYNSRGVAMQEQKRFEEALDSYERALKVKPDYAEAYYNRGLTLHELKRFEAALDSYERALKIAPDHDCLYGTWLHTKIQLCDWSNLDSRITDLATNIRQANRATPPFSVLALIDSLSLQRQAAETWVRERHPPSEVAPPRRTRSRQRRIRVGYYSADYHSHATSYLMAELFERHDRERFELLAFSYGPDNPDDMRKRLVAAFDQFMDVRLKSDIEVARLSTELGIDVAVDLKGFTQDARTGIFSCRAAPIQVSYLGYPGTMGAPYIDYIVADQILIPQESRQQYSERIVYLPHSYQVNDRRRRIADREFARHELGLPSTGFVFCCFNNNYKIMPHTFDGWMRILRQVEGSVLWLLEVNETAVDNLRREAQARDVNAERLIFAKPMPLPEHLARHRAADLFIDTLPYNAHTTASDALWAGLPVLTRMGESFAARVGASLLNAVGMPELATATQEQYEATAIELATNPGRLTALKDRLRKNRLSVPLFNTEQFSRHLENAYMQMYERYQAGLGPEHIYVAR